MLAERVRSGGRVAEALEALVTLALLQARRGHPGAADTLQEATERAFSTGELQFIGPVAVARAEHAWLYGEDHRVAEEAELAFELAVGAAHPWFAGDLAFWLWLVGALPQTPPGLAEPYRLLLAGDWRAAAAAWQALGCPTSGLWRWPAATRTRRCWRPWRCWTAWAPGRRPSGCGANSSAAAATSPPRPDPGHGRQPGRAHRPAGRGAEVAGRRAQQRRDRRACRYRPRPSSTTSRRCWPSSGGSGRVARPQRSRAASGSPPPKMGSWRLRQGQPRSFRLLRLLGCAGKSVQEVEHEQATSGCLGACGVGPLGGYGAPARARPRSVATVASPRVVLDWNATAAATLLASGKPQQVDTSA